jgi:hypothetical protein
MFVTLVGVAAHLKHSAQPPTMGQSFIMTLYYYSITVGQYYCTQYCSTNATNYWVVLRVLTCDVSPIQNTNQILIMVNSKLFNISLHIFSFVRRRTIVKMFFG